jgi:hypothetical protein
MDSVTNIVFDLSMPKESSLEASIGKTSVFDMATFDSLYHYETNKAAEQVTFSDSQNEQSGFKKALEILDNLNSGINTLGIDSLSISAETKNFTPGEILKLTVQANQFLFQSQLTTNIANRTSDGIQQLFRQQS